MKMQQDFMKLALIAKESKIVMPETAGGLPQKGKDMEMFTVEEVGKGHFEHGTFHPVKVKKGDIVYIVAFMSFARDQKVLVFGRARDVIAIA